MISLLAVCCWSCSHKSPWLTVAVDDRVMVQVPSKLQQLEPSALGMSNTPGRIILGAEDADGMYLVTLKTVGVITNRDRYYDGLVIGILKGTHGTLLSRASFPTRDGKGMEIRFKAHEPNTGKGFIQYSRSIVVGDVDYSFSFISKDSQDTTGVSGSPKRKKFFESIAVNSATEPTQ